MKNIEAIYPLSATQEGMLYHTLYAPQSTMYFQQIFFTVRALDRSAFKRAWEHVANRHAVLRSFFWLSDVKKAQVVCKGVRIDWDEQDWSDVAPAEQQKRLANYLQADRQRGIEVSRPPLMRCALMRLSDDVYQFIWSFHHMILDGWSCSVVLKEVFLLTESYRKGIELELEPARSYQDYIAWLQEQDMSRAERFWRGLLKGFHAPTPLGIGHARKLAGETEFGDEILQLSAGATAALQSFARQHQLTLPTLCQAAWAVLLSRYGGEKDVIFGTTVAGRPPDLTGIESMVGLFINTLPFRVQVHKEQDVLPWLESLQAQQLEIQSYDYAPLVKVHGWSELPRRAPLFESILVFENYPLERQGAGSELQIGDVHSIERTNYPLTIVAVPGERLSLHVSYRTEALDPQAVKRLLKHFEVVLEAFVTHGEQPLGRLPMLGEEERRQILVEWNDTGVNFPEKSACIHELISRKAQQAADEVAVVFEGQQLTYGQLNRRANQLAHYLRKRGVGPDVLVGICMQRSLELVVGLLAILKAGGAYVPLDPDYPPQRLAFMLEDAQVGVLLTQERLKESLPQHRAELVYVDADEAAIGEESPADPENRATPENLAYVMYTSGSTGTPKAAMNHHRGLTNRLLWMQQAYQLSPADRVLQKTPFSFDVSVWEFFWPLMAGAELVVARPGGHQDSRYLLEVIESQQITVLHFVPSMLQAFLEQDGVEECGSIRQVICSGEALSYELQELFFARSGARLDNLYGPTEAAIDVASWECQRKGESKVVPIGRPIANTQIYLLDESLQPVPPGVLGELHIGGVQLARGYWRRPELTAEKFIPNPFSDVPGDRLYKTGDLARYWPNGTIEFVGRLDHQVKIRGFRIELGEIEAVLSQSPGVLQCVVTAQESKSGEKRLVAYVVANPQGPAPAPGPLRASLKQKLPEYMVPGIFVMLENLPLTPNGKVDRRALPEPEQTRPELGNPYMAPRTPVEQVLADIWAKVLRVEKVGVHDDFFELGGESLLATQVIFRAREVLQTDLPLQALFENPTIAELATAIAQQAAPSETPLAEEFSELELLSEAQGPNTLELPAEANPTS